MLRKDDDYCRRRGQNIDYLSEAAFFCLLPLNLWLFENAKNSSLRDGGGWLLLTAAATADEKILREGRGLRVEASFLCKRSRVSLNAPFDWLSFSDSRSLSCLSRLFSSKMAAIADCSANTRQMSIPHSYHPYITYLMMMKKRLVARCH